MINQNIILPRWRKNMREKWEHIRKLLEKEHKSLLTEFQTMEKVVIRDSFRTYNAFGQKEEASAAYTEMERRHYSSGKLQARLHEIEEALRKLDAGTYGLCEKCGRVIPSERLEAIPHTTYCINCKGKT
jgi:RNA polymerase-binding protein DksA